jgi:hypothetical protein
MIGVRALIGASFVVALSVGSASAIPIAPNSVTNVTVPNVYIGQASFNPFQVFDITYTFNLPSAVYAITTAVVLDAQPGPPAIYGITNLFYEWVGLTGPIQISDGSGNYTGAIPTTLTGIVSTTPLILHVFTGNGITHPFGSALDNGGGYQVSLSVDQAPVPGALVLFGSVIAGGIGGLQMMRRRRRASVA